MRAGDERLTRAAVLATVAGAWRVHPRVVLGADFAIGWQLYDGSVGLADGRVSGTEPRGLRLEAAGHFAFTVSRRWSWLLRGGLAVDGVYSAAASGSTKASAFVETGPRFEF